MVPFVKESEAVLTGKQVYTRLLTEADSSDRYAAWLNDPSVNEYLQTRSSSIEELRKYIALQRAKEDTLFWGIFTKPGDLHIGNVKLEPIDKVARSATIGILIGDKDYWGKGIASEVIEMVTNFAFTELNLTEIRLGVLSGNRAAIRAYQKGGFVEVGRDSGRLTNSGVAQDQIWMVKVKS